ncbi:MAG TPA: MarR family winged helix-turn-helix transcriptional regulator [Segeticoccus sp.]|uniref:MarR family winged helix-turn-helix transcriptional regulator n=1 Tax=Segeticoccus sp. TaxID=2706531 RepID=UPI002D8002BE|nr:MarR family winged helix-turn-helix transcriptional regulator [Segeticoccus sp.]HET8602043.1 MarR family winged helix-turn-helix transcriptional regulator [Segeticoccus sp.]
MDPSTVRPGRRPETERPVGVAAVRSLARVARLLERAAGDLPLAQYRVLCAVAEGEERAARLAERLAVGKPTVSASVDALCKRGLLRRHTVPGDQRAVRLALTAQGDRALRDVETALAERLAAVVQHDDDPAGLLQALARLGPAIEQLHVERAHHHG